MPSNPNQLTIVSHLPLMIEKRAATIIALMVQPEQITSGHKKRPQRWQPERKGGNELKHFAFLWGMWPRFFFKEKYREEREKGRKQKKEALFFLCLGINVTINAALPIHSPSC